MLEKGKDLPRSARLPTLRLATYPVVEVLNRSGEVSGTLGILPQLKPYAKYLPDPFFSKDLAAVDDLAGMAGMAVARVSARLDAKKGEAGEQRADLLARL